MKIIVSMKQVPARDSLLRVNGEGKWLDTTDLSYEMNEPDAYALEEALQIREKAGGEVVVVSFGPARAAQALREALAKGADRAIHVEADEAGAPDALSTARSLAEAIRPEKPDLILTGLQSDDLGYGQTGVIVAEILGFAHATIVMEIVPEAGRLRVKRELEDGWYQYVTLPLPAVLTVQSGIRKLRYATLMGIKKAKSKELRNVPGPQAAVAGIEKLYSPNHSKGTQILSGDPSEAAHQLLAKLRSEARVL